MFKRFLVIALAYLSLASIHLIPAGPLQLGLEFAFDQISFDQALAQNTLCATRPPGDATNSCASTAYVNNVAGYNSVTPEQFYRASDNGDYAPAIDRAQVYLASLSGKGTLRFSCGTMYNMASLSANGQSVMRAISGINVIGCGRGSGISIADNMNTLHATFTAVWANDGNNAHITVTGISGTISDSDSLFVSNPCNMASTHNCLPPGTQIVFPQVLGTPGGNGVYLVSTDVHNFTAAATTYGTHAFVYGVYATGALSNVYHANYDIDMRGATNSCSGKCWATNAAMGALSGDRITVDNVCFLNNPGSNDTAFGGTGVTPPPVTNLSLINPCHNNSGDAVNIASADFSADFMNASNSNLIGPRYSNGPTLNGAAWEVHGDGVVVDAAVITNYFNCGIISNEVLSPAVSNIRVGNVKCSNIYGYGVQIASRPSASDTNISIDGLTVDFITGKSGNGVDACSVVDVATGSNVNLSLDNITIRSDVTTDLGNDTTGICVGKWSTVRLGSIQTYNTQGPGIYFPASVAGENITINGAQINGPGRTSTLGQQRGLLMVNSVANIGALNISTVNVNGIGGSTYIYGFDLQQASTSGFVFGNTAPNFTSDIYNPTMAAGFTLVKNPGSSGNWPTDQTVFEWKAAQSFDATKLIMLGSGGTNQFVKQGSAAGALTAGVISTTEILGAISQRSTFSNAAYAMQSGDLLIAQIGMMTAQRAVTLPLSSSVPAGRKILIVDESGTPTSTNNIALTPSGADTLNGSNSANQSAIPCGFCYVELEADGVSKWTSVRVSIGSNLDVGGIVAVANGGTGDSGTAWTSFSPTISCDTPGSFAATVNSAAWKSIGKTTWVRVKFTVTNVGSCAANLTTTIPSNLFADTVFIGRDITSGIELASYGAAGTALLGLAKYDGTNPTALHAFVVNGTYESQ